MKKKFILNYVGQKYEESKKEMSKINLSYDKVKTVVEPFGGSFGFSRWLYYDKKLKDIEYHVYDIDSDLINFFNHLKSLSLEEFINFFDRYNKIQDSIYTICQMATKSPSRTLDSKKLIKYFETIEEPNMKFMVKTNNKRNQYCKISYKENMDEYYEMLKKVSFFNIGIKDLDFEKYDFDTTLFYLDPPYLACDNSFYKDFDTFGDIFDTIEMILETYPSIFVHVKYPLITKCFKNYYYGDYPKLYQMKKHQVYHDIFINNISVII